MKRKELIRKLLLTNRLSVPERKMFKDHPITIAEAKESIKGELKKHRFFPPVTDNWQKNKFYYDGLVIEEQGANYILHQQVSGPVMNLVFDKEDTFASLDEVVERYLREGNLNIDGVSIVE